MADKTPRKRKLYPEAIAKYKKKSYDYVSLRFNKGKREIVKEHALHRGESLNGFINRAVDETMARDNDKTKEQD